MIYSKCEYLGVPNRWERDARDAHGLKVRGGGYPRTLGSEMPLSRAYFTIFGCCVWTLVCLSGPTRPRVNTLFARSRPRLQDLTKAMATSQMWTQAQPAERACRGAAAAERRLNGVAYTAPKSRFPKKTER